MEKTIIEILRKSADSYYNEGEYYKLTDNELDTVKTFLTEEVSNVCDDALFDKIEYKARQTYKMNPYFLNIGSSVRGDKVDLPVRTGSMVECKKGEIMEWLVKDTNIVISSKLDGNSALLCYDNGKLKIAYSRGDGYSGQDITRHITKLNNVPKQLSTNFSGFVRGEVIIKRKDITSFIDELEMETNKHYSNGRNGVAGQLNSKECSQSFEKYGRFVAYKIIDYKDSEYQMFETLKDMGFDVPKFQMINVNDLTEDMLIDICTQTKSADEYECDGIIITQNNTLKGYEGFETSTLNPKNSRKYKVSTIDYSKVTKLVGIKWQVSQYGTLKPVGVIEPIELEGAIVSNVTLYNMQFILDNNIKIGCNGRIIRSGGVIPKWIETL